MRLSDLPDGIRASPTLLRQRSLPRIFPCLLLPSRGQMIVALCARFTGDDLILRDWLAADRTALANERTLLAYVRTALTLGTSGGSAVHFLEGPVVDALGWTLIGAGAIALAIGVMRFVRMQRQLRRLSKAPGVERHTG